MSPLLLPLRIQCRMTTASASQARNPSIAGNYPADAGSHRSAGRIGGTIITGGTIERDDQRYDQWDDHNLIFPRRLPLLLFARQCNWATKIRCFSPTLIETTSVLE
jgi:hypothetical protein